MHTISRNSRLPENKNICTLWVYILAGMPMGSIIMLILINLASQSKYGLFGGGSSDTIAAFLLFYFVASLILSFIPALMTAIYLFMMKVHFNLWGIIHATLAGSIFSYLFAIILLYRMIQNSPSFYHEIWYLDNTLLSFALVGGITSLILAPFGLTPKSR